MKASKKVVCGIIAVYAVLAGASCVSTRSSTAYAEIDRALYREGYAQGAEVLEQHKDRVYRDKDAVLYYLDKGMLTHFAGDYGDSTRLLQEGERAIEAAFTKSVTMEVGSYILNDTTREYDGEDYEDIYINAFNALNYYHLHNTEDALVEIRRMTNKLRFLSSKYGVMTSNLQQLALEESVDLPGNPSAPVEFNDSALARYLGLLFYRGEGKTDDARIDLNYLKLAFANAPGVYSFPLPSSLDDELTIPPGKARLNVIGFSGLSPVKQEEAIRVPVFRDSRGSWSRYIKIALPVMTDRPSAVDRIEVSLSNGERFNLELLEDIRSVARETFKAKVGVIYLKSVLRGIVKGYASSSLDAASNRVGGQEALLLGVLSLGAQVFAEASEQADLRISRYFPAQAHVGGINLDPGVYSLSLTYYAANGRVIASYAYDNVTVEENHLNLTEVVCLR
jgi:hypothetical protein